jgi:hypothetical protein
MRRTRFAPVLLLSLAVVAALPGGPAAPSAPEDPVPIR